MIGQCDYCTRRGRDVAVVPGSGRGHASRRRSWAGDAAWREAPPDTLEISTANLHAAR
ncbi:unnamed protein product [Chondrus crispus]|uniref:Uncharacterized protein n=1 Tax=Chondrus crispus TaxID=2769 RepID=R7Q6G3_CHOCR|nr:unnamed protein product [Chondrus crispus]CDF33609.1 unnamed protein product [Chondrus crispus]|eukprot:XP_005713412.1 unnamed protein product [Chondrus crispus]